MAEKGLQYWSVWYPKASSTGVLVGRGGIDPTEQLLFHAAPETMTVEVHDGEGKRIAYGENLERTQESPMCLLVLDGETVTRTDIWPTAEHEGLPLLLPGGEAGVLKTWWHAEDKKEWRWNLELYNSIR